METQYRKNWLCRLGMHFPGAYSRGSLGSYLGGFPPCDRCGRPGLTLGGWPAGSKARRYGGTLHAMPRFKGEELIIDPWAKS